MLLKGQEYQDKARELAMSLGAEGYTGGFPGDVYFGGLSGFKFSIENPPPEPYVWVKDKNFHQVVQLAGRRVVNKELQKKINELPVVKTREVNALFAFKPHTHCSGNKMMFYPGCRYSLKPGGDIAVSFSATAIQGGYVPVEGMVEITYSEFLKIGDHD